MASAIHSSAEPSPAALRRQQQQQQQQLLLRRILPAGPPSRAIADAALRPGGLRSRVLPKSTHVKGACDACRDRKIKCSGARPKCAACERTGSVCHYVSSPAETRSQAMQRKLNQLVEEKSVYEELCQVMCSMSEQEAIEVVRRLRGGDKVSAILRQIKTGCLLLQLSVAPECRLRYSFPYISEMPGRLRLPGNPYADSPILDDWFPILNRNPPPAPDAPPSRYQCAYLKPYHAAQILDPRLSKVHAARWTAVISDDDLFRKLLHAYLLHEHTTYPYIQKDWLLDGMVEGDTRFCSSLLVNTILATACHCYRGIPDRGKFWKPKSLGYQFLSEARRLWEVECKSGDVSLTTAQSGVLLCVEYNHNGMDKIGSSFLENVVNMASDLGIFDLETHNKIQCKKMRDACGYFAWGLYNWVVVQGFYFFRVPLLSEPPAIPLPEVDEYPEWYGDFNLQYPVSPVIVPANHGHTINSVSKLRLILHHIARRAFRDKEPNEWMSWGEAMTLKSMLDNWFQNLPEPIKPRNVVFPWHLKIHTEYYAALYTLFTSVNIIPDPYHWPHVPTETAEDIAARAITSVETVLRLYYLRHSFAFYDAFLIYYLSLLTKATQETLRRAEQGPPLDSNLVKTLRSTIVLCMKGVNEQGQNNYISEVIFRVLRDNLSAQDMSLLRANVSLFEWTEDDMFMAQQCHSQWPLPLIKTSESPRDKGLDRLVKKYDRLSM